MSTSIEKQQYISPQCWIEECRKSLIDSEEQNLRTRALYWTQIVNMKTKEFNDKLNIRLNSSFKSFVYEILSPIASHLNYLVSWKGLRSEKMSVLPTKYQEFEFKAKNWVCGRRAPNYANTLFPEMILSAENYANEFSFFLFQDAPRVQKLYQMGLMFGYLSCLCSSKITLNDRSKKTYLMFENSLKKEKNPTVQLLQKYAVDINDANGNNHPRFPTNLQCAFDYFDMKYKDAIQLLRDPILSLYQKRSQINPNQFKQINADEKQLYAVINNLLYLQQQQQNTMYHLTSRIRQLESILINKFNIDLRQNEQQQQQQQHVILPQFQQQTFNMYNINDNNNGSNSNVVFVPMMNTANPIIYNNCNKVPVNNVFAMMSNS